MSEDEIVSIFKNKLGKDVIGIADCSHGAEQSVLIVETDGHDRYVIKIPHAGNEMMIAREIFACERLEDEIPVPRIIARGAGYLIESFLEGEMLSKAELSSASAEKVYAQLGKAVRHIHYAEMSGFGEMQPHGSGKHDKLARHVSAMARRDIPLLKETGIFTDREIAALHSHLKEKIRHLDHHESVLLHFDLLDTNVLVKDGELAGLIDFGDLGCGPRAYDLAKFYIEKRDTPHLASFLGGYGDIDMDEIEYFAVLHLMYEIPYYHVHDRDKNARLIGMLRDLIGK